jgi:radical SAM protein with 4Fe4S-binding SPASM domain
MCDTHSIHNKEKLPIRTSMSKLLLERSINEALNVGVKEIIPSTMGEPLMYEHFDVFIDKLSHSNTKLNLTTNGTFPKHGVKLWAEKLLPILSDIKISLNSIDPQVNENIMIGDKTNKKIEDIKAFSSFRNQGYPDVSITLQVTFLKSNIDYMENLIRFAIENHIDRVKGHQLWITYNEISDQSIYSSKDSIAAWNELVERISPYREKIKLVNFDKISINNENDILVNSGCCPFLGEELWIDYNGNFNICCAPSYERVKLGQWGNIETRSIEELFNSVEYNRLKQNYQTEEVCKKCPLRRPCD